MFLWFLPDTHPRNLDIRQHAENTNNITTPPNSTSSSGPHHEHVAGPRCTAVASCSIGGCDPSSVITASLSLLLCCPVLCCACVVRCGVSNARHTAPHHTCTAQHSVWRAPRKIRRWIFGNMVKWSRCPILDLMA